MLEQPQLDNLKRELFRDSGTNLYAIIDGAACPELRFKIFDYQPQSSCLWSGKLEPDLEEVAPYMVKLEINHAFTNWLLAEGWGKHWNIFVSSELDVKAFRKQIRKLLLVRSPEGKTLVFRFYDPRVMDMFLPTCTEEQLYELFDGVFSILFFQDETENLIRYDKSDSNDNDSLVSVVTYNSF